MPLFARSDVMSVAVPVTSGGCGSTHSRPVVEGVPETDWDLEKQCMQCAANRRGDPLWSATLAEIPETPDERLSREDAEKRGERAIKKAQEELSVRQHELTEKIVSLLERGGTPAQLPDPDFIARLVAQEVAKAMNTPEPSPPERFLPVPRQEFRDGPFAPSCPPDLAIPVDVPLERLHVRTLGKMCRERGLDDKGKKADLIARLAA